MKTFASLAALLHAAGLATAVNLSAYSTQQCSGGAYATCSNINANTCCTILRSGNTAGAVSLGYYNLPSKAQVLGWQTTRDGNLCGSALSNHVVSTANVCVTEYDGSQYSGVSWAKVSSKRARNAASTCTAKQAADLITLADGTTYPLDKLSDVDIEELWTLAIGGAGHAAVPEKFLTITQL